MEKMFCVVGGEIRDNEIFGANFVSPERAEECGEVVRFGPATWAECAAWCNVNRVHA